VGCFFDFCNNCQFSVFEKIRIKETLGSGILKITALKNHEFWAFQNHERTTGSHEGSKPKTNSYLTFSQKKI
jgi:hypothetical protein